MSTIANHSALGLLSLRISDGPRFTFDGGRVWMESPHPEGGYRPANEVRNPDRFGPVPVDSSRKGLAAGRAWVAEFHRQAAES